MNIHEIWIVARKRTKCFCRRWVNPGEHIVWNKRLRATSGCIGCVPSGNLPKGANPPSDESDDDDPWWWVL